MASKSLALTVRGPVIWPLVSFELPLLLRGPLSAVRDFGGVGVTGEFPALSHRFLLILQRVKGTFFLFAVVLFISLDSFGELEILVVEISAFSLI